MRAWQAPVVPELPVRGPRVRVHSSRGQQLVETPAAPDATEARMYVCGITPYDATHMGHANTYVAFDLLQRAWRNAGLGVRYVQNVTDVDDPLLERATATGVDWRELAERETQLFREDMEALRVIPPAAYVGAVEAIDLVVDMVRDLQERGSVYEVPGEHSTDLYFRVHDDPDFGGVSGWSREQMLEVFPQRGGDPDREGKQDPLDCLLWQGERPDDPAWDSALGRGRPGWHIECSAIAREHLGAGIDVQGGGSDLVFPHHEMSASEAQVVDPEAPFAHAYVHGGMVGYDGEKMSKSKGNLVLVSRLRGDDVDPMAIRLALMAHHYRDDWEWFDADLTAAQQRLATWREALADPAPIGSLVEDVLAALADDIDAPRALELVDQWAEKRGGGDADVVRRLLDAALGLSL